MPTLVTTEIFKFNELSENAREKARAWYREGCCEDSFWSDSVITDVKEIGKLMGFDISKVYFSGFNSQGDGAMFEGVFRSSEFEAGGIKALAPKDTELQRIANEIEAIINQFHFVYLKVNHSGHYYHENCTNFNVSIMDNEDNEVDTKAAADAEQELICLSKDFMKWIYRNLESEYDYQNSDKTVDENIENNSYDFTVDGAKW